MRGLSLLINRNLVRAFASEAGQGAKSPPSTSAPPKAKVVPPPPPPPVDPLKNVTGLSKAVMTANEQKQVIGTGKVYLNTPYFGYNKDSFAEAEVEMEKFRITQPIAPRK